MNKQEQDTTLEIDPETLKQLRARDREDMAQRQALVNLFEIATDVIDTTGCLHRDGIKQWLPAYPGFTYLKETLQTLIFDATLDRAIEHWNK